METTNRMGKTVELVTRRVLRTRAAADYLGISPSTLEKMRSGKRGPRCVRLGGRAVGYDIQDLDGWLEENREVHDAATATKPD